MYSDSKCLELIIGTACLRNMHFLKHTSLFVNFFGIFIFVTSFLFVYFHIWAVGQLTVDWCIITVICTCLCWCVFVVALSVNEVHLKLGNNIHNIHMVPIAKKGPFDYYMLKKNVMTSLNFY